MRLWSRALLLLIVAALGAGYYYRADLNEWFKGAKTKITEEIGVLKEIQKEVFAPTPLRGPIEETPAFLTAGGTIIETNRQRAANGSLPALTFNAQLAAAAQAKVDDMFARQYFAHESPSGAGPSDLADAAGYEYLMVGENLALGNFADDATLVQAWMDSPGHRANILNARYTEIGVAVKRGVYEGHNVWLAVQEFGRPLSDCPAPSESLDARIEAHNAELGQMQAELNTREEEIKANRRKRGTEYERQVEEYNALVEQYNELVAETKAMIADYNFQVNEFNACIE